VTGRCEHSFRAVSSCASRPEGGLDGTRGANYLVRKDKSRVYLGGKNRIHVESGEVLQILTPGGGGFGSPN
jgi:5-oxoprolinase (ATP-hydrolysing)